MSVVIALHAGRKILRWPQKGMVGKSIGCKVVDGSLDALRNITYVKTGCAAWRTASADQVNEICEPSGAFVEILRHIGGGTGEFHSVV